MYLYLLTKGKIVCNSKLLLHNFTVTGYYECLCQVYYTGINCQHKDMSVTAGIGKPTIATPTRPALPEKCLQIQCDIKAGNGECDVSLYCYSIGTKVIKILSC